MRSDTDRKRGRLADAGNFAPEEAVTEQGRQAAPLEDPVSLGEFRSAPWATALTFLLSDVVAVGAVLGIAWITADYFTSVELSLARGVLAMFAPLLCLSYALSGLYRANTMHPAQELRRVTTVTAVVTLSSVVSGWLVGAAPPTVGLLVLMSLLALLFVPCCRALFRILFARAAWWGTPVLVVGSGAAGSAVVRALRRWPELGLKPIALLQDGADGRAHGVPVGSVEQATLLAEAHSIPYAIVAMPDLSRYQAAGLVERYGTFFERIFVIPDTSSAQRLWTTSNTYEGLLGYGVQHYHWHRGARLLKRGIDLAVSACALTLLAPLLLLVPVLIKLDSQGTVFFKQERMGRGGECFTVYKFRTMYQNAEVRLQEILSENPRLREEYQRFRKLKDDPRVTPVGRWLRQYSLDELPQLLNVFWGDMSLVGPRAYLPTELADMNGMARAVLQSPPGITGLWQVSGRNQLTFEERVELDVHYMHNWTPWLDCYIMARTLPVVLTGDGAS